MKKYSECVRGTCGGYYDAYQSPCAGCPHYQSGMCQLENDSSVGTISKIIIFSFILIVVLWTVKPFLESYQMAPQEESSVSYNQEVDVRAENSTSGGEVSAYGTENYSDEESEYSTGTDGYGIGTSSYISYGNEYQN